MRRTSTNGLSLLAQVERFDDSQKQAQAAINADPTRAEPHELLGSLLARRRDLDGALREYREAVRLKPSFSRAQLDLAAALVAAGHTDEALAPLREAAKSTDPRSQPPPPAPCSNSPASPEGARGHRDRNEREKSPCRTCLVRHSQFGVNIVRRACEEPVRQIVLNCGTEGAVVVEKIRRQDDPNYGGARNAFEKALSVAPATLPLRPLWLHFFLFRWREPIPNSA